jgi:hypothetical protein
LHLLPKTPIVSLRRYFSGGIVQLPGNDVLIIMGVGVLFVILAVLAIFWGRAEQKSYDNVLMGRPDLREYVNHWPPRPEAGALKTGGWIALVIGLILLILGGFFWIIR